MKHLKFVMTGLIVFAAGAAFAADKAAPKKTVAKKEEAKKDDLGLTKEQEAKKDEMVKFVKDAVAEIRKNGKDAAFKKFSNKQDTEFHKNGGELYMYVYDYNHKCLAHGQRPTLIGTDATNLQDADKKTFIIQELAKVAKAKKAGFFKYPWSNPVHDKVEPKLGYVEDVDGEYFVGSGIYLE
jgi:signal transduction histidine kinase